MNKKVIRASYNSETITIYQAYNNSIAEPALKYQTFTSPPFKKERMTWIKPSFLWMMYRSGWATKENQENILAIKIKREGFEWALQNACLTYFNKMRHISKEDWQKIHKESEVLIQWDPERDLFMQPLPYRSIQIGLSRSTVEKYISEWIVNIDDITYYCKNLHQLIKDGNINEANKLMPKEKIYPVSNSIAQNIDSN